MPPRGTDEQVTTTLDVRVALLSDFSLSLLTDPPCRLSSHCSGRPPWPIRRRWLAAGLFAERSAVDRFVSLLQDGRIRANEAR